MRVRPIGQAGRVMTAEQSAVPRDDRLGPSGREARLRGNPDALPANYQWMALFITTLGGGPVRSSPRNRGDLVSHKADDCSIKWHVELGDAGDTAIADHVSDHGLTMSERCGCRSDSRPPSGVVVSVAASVAATERVDSEPVGPYVPGGT